MCVDKKQIDRRKQEDYRDIDHAEHGHHLIIRIRSDIERVGGEIEDT